MRGKIISCDLIFEKFQDIYFLHNRSGTRAVKIDAVH